MVNVLQYGVWAFTTPEPHIHRYCTISSVVFRHRLMWRSYALSLHLHHIETHYRHPDTGFIKITHLRESQQCASIWCPESESNRHSLRNLILSQARLPISPFGQCTEQLFKDRC